MKVDQQLAKRILLEEAAKAEADLIDSVWEADIEQFSKICEQATRTHIAFLGTALLAKAVNINVDVFAVKAGDDDPGAYSARGLGHGVLVPLSPQLGINLGVTGREPLNNQPYFRIMRVSRDIPIHGNARPALEKLCDLLDIASGFKNTQQAREALRAFIHVRRRYSPTYAKFGAVGDAMSPEQLVSAIDTFVRADSEGGKRAQAIVAGLMDLYAGSDRVETTRVNDPDRHIPGDVGVHIKDDPNLWEKMIEVRDKPVKEADLYHFAQKAVDAKIGNAAVVAVALNQPSINLEEVCAWASTRGVVLSLFIGWDDFVKQILFWSAIPPLTGVREVPKLIYERIIGLEVSEQGAKQWLSLIGDNKHN